MQQQKPNIILILADDMGYSDIGCFGSEIETPNLDALAEGGLRFTHMYNNARCCPSRAALLTGLYPHQAGVGLMVSDMGLPSYQGYLNDRCATIAESLRTVGYRTSMAGKWHVGGSYGKSPEALRRADTVGYPTPNSRGFERFWGILEGAGDYFNPMTLQQDGEWIDPARDEGFYLTDRITDNAVRMIDEMGDDPFFLYVAYNAPHWPLHAPEEVIARYRGKYLGGWAEARAARFDKQRRLGIVECEWPISPQDPDAPDWKDVVNPDWEDARMAVYAAQVDRMDEGIGRIVGRLREKGLFEDTVVIFLSDNGGCAEELHAHEAWLAEYVSGMRDGTPVRYGNDPSRLPGGEDTYMSYGLPWANVSNTPFRLYKHWIHEGGIATPMVVSWPRGIGAPGGIVGDKLHFIDVLPTLLDLAGAEHPAELDGVSRIPPEGEVFTPLLRREPWRRKRPIFWEHEGNAGVMDGAWKLVRKYPGDWELYNIDADRTEQCDVIIDHRDRVAEMTAWYEAWAARIGIVPPEVLRDGASRRG